MTKLSVAIIGAGIGGLATAAALQRVGIAAQVFEQAPQFARLGAGIQIGCNAMKVLRKLGLEPILRAQAFYPRSWNNRDYDTDNVRFDMMFGESAEQRYGAPYLLAHRGDLHAALTGAVRRDAIHLGHKLTGLDWRLDGRVELTFAEGKVVEADAVVAPYMAQGAAMAIEDAAVLSLCLKGVTREGVADASRRFEATRKERTSRVQLTSRANTWLKDPANPDWVYGYDAWNGPLAA